MMSTGGHLVRKARPFASYFAAVADTYRLSIVYLLSFDPLSPKDIARLLNISPALVSHHLRILLREEWIKRRGEKKQVTYELNPRAFTHWKKLFAETPVSAQWQERE